MFGSMQMKPNQLAERLRCPVCLAILCSNEEGFECTAEPSHRFPVVDGIPILLNEPNSVFRISDYVNAEAGGSSGGIAGGLYSSEKTHNALGRVRRKYRKLVRMLTEFRVKLDTLMPTDAIQQLSDERGQALDILVIGAGDTNLEASEFAHRVFTTDVAFGGALDAICDAHDIPFADKSFDLVLAVAVLEHVADPYRVVEEVHRVLKTDGYIYAATPYMQPTHMGVYDFTRFSYNGYRRLFRCFEERYLGQALGPASALAFSIIYFLTSFSDKKSVISSLRLFGLIITRPLKYIDKIMIKKKSALDGAAGFVFFGRRSIHTISDRELVELLQARRVH